MMTSPTMGWSLSAPVHLVHIFGLPCSSFGSARPVILPKSLPPCSYISTWDLTLPLFSSTVFHVPGTSLARSVPTPNSITNSTAVTSPFIDPPSRRIREIRAASCAKRWEGGYGTLGQYRVEEVHLLMGRRFLGATVPDTREGSRHAEAPDDGPSALGRAARRGRGGRGGPPDARQQNRLARRDARDCRQPALAPPRAAPRRRVT